MGERSTQKPASFAKGNVWAEKGPVVETYRIAQRKLAAGRVEYAAPPEHIRATVPARPRDLGERGGLAGRAALPGCPVSLALDGTHLPMEGGVLGGSVFRLKWSGFQGPRSTDFEPRDPRLGFQCRMVQRFGAGA